MLGSVDLSDLIVESNDSPEIPDRRGGVGGGGGGGGGGGWGGVTGNTRPPFGASVTEAPWESNETKTLYASRHLPPGGDLTYTAWIRSLCSQPQDDQVVVQSASRCRV